MKLNNYCQSCTKSPPEKNNLKYYFYYNHHSKDNGYYISCGCHKSVIVKAAYENLLNVKLEEASFDFISKMLLLI